MHTAHSACTHHHSLTMDRRGMVVFSGTSHPELAELVANRLSQQVGKCEIIYGSGREIKVNLMESIRGKDVFIIQTGTPTVSVNNVIMEMLIMSYACKTAAAKRIVGVIPYLPYSRQSKMKKRGAIVSKLLATMLCRAGMTHVITMDLHQKEIQGFFDIPVDNLRASPFLIQFIQEKIPDYRNAVIVARNPSQARRATSFAERLRLGLAVIHGEGRRVEEEQDDGRYSPPPPSPQKSKPLELDPLPAMKAKEKPPMTVVGDVGGRIAIIVEDMIDVVDSFVTAAEVLKERGAYKVYVMCTHGLMSQAEANAMIENSDLDGVIVTNTIPHSANQSQCNKIFKVDISLLISEAMRRIHHGESMSYLFRNISMDD